MYPAEAALKALLDQRAEKTFPALAMAIGKGDKLIWQAAAGYADAKNHLRATPETLFGIGSITKVFVAVIILQLVEEGSLTLDAFLADWLAEESLAGVANAETVTVRQLLAHYSGIPSWENQQAWIYAARGREVKPDKIWLPEENLDFIRGKSLLCQPGEAFHYSNSNFTLLGLLIEKVTSHAFEEALRQRIIGPLRLKNTFLETSFSSGRKNLAKRFHRLDAHFIKNAGISAYFKAEPGDLLDVSAVNLSVEWAAGGIVSTAQDVMTFILALKNGKLLNPESMAAMQRWLPADSGEMGLSLFRINTDGGPATGHGGNVLGASACVWWYEKANCAVALLTNVGSMHAAPEADCASALFKNSAAGSLARQIAAHY